MNNHKPFRGFCYSLLTALMWGTLPIAAEQVLQVLDAQTLVSFRFLTAFLGLWLILWYKKKLPKITQLGSNAWYLMLLGVVALAGNFLLFSLSLHYISPMTTQVVIQLSPFLMIIASVFLFKEHFGFYQKIGMLLLIGGLAVFFYDRLTEIISWGNYAWGVFLISSASVVWVGYAIAQKILLKSLSSQQILLIIYMGCTIMLIGSASPQYFVKMNSFIILCFIYCCINTVLGYGAYAEALRYWDSSKVSAVTVLIPIITMIFSLLSYQWLPHYFSEPQISLTNFIGAMLVVLGALISALSKGK